MLCLTASSSPGAPQVIDPFAELRAAEYVARASSGQRCVLTDGSGAVAPKLLDEIGHRNGYAALGWATDEEGDASHVADAITLDESARALRGGGDLRACVITAGHPGLVARVEVAGETVVVDGRHVGKARAS